MGSNETPPNASTATGTVELTIDTSTNTVLFTLTFSGFSGPSTAAHIHQGAVGVAGPVKVPLPLGGALNQTSATTSGTGVPMAGFNVSNIISNPSDFYVNIHSTVFPGGEIRGQLISCASTSQLTVSTQDQNGQTITGYYTVLFQNGSIFATSFSPSTFTLVRGQSYAVQVDDFGPCHFDHWLDTGSTTSKRSISISSDTQLTAVYSCSTSSIQVLTTNSGGSQIAGYYATLSINGTQLQNCFSPCSFTVSNGQTYVVAVANFDSEAFSHWSDNSGNAYPWGGSHLVTVPGGNTSTTTLTAIYSP
jgi:hypothetical protein